jgi:hypothetical protein
MMEAVSVSTAISLVEFTAPSDAIVVLLEAWIAQEASEVSTQEVAQILRKSAAGTGTGSPTAKLLQGSDAAFGGTVRVQMTAEGTPTDSLIREGFNILNGWSYRPIPESRIYVAPSGILALKFPVAPAAATFTAGMIFMEIG